MAVVKMILPQHFDAESVGYFRRDTAALRNLDSPHVVHLLDWALREYNRELDQEVSYIVVDYVEGQPLAEITAARGPFTEEDALATTQQAAMGLAAIHNTGIVHRYLTARDVMVTPERDVRLIDLGIVKRADRATRTRYGTLIAAFQYLSPERLRRDQDPDPRADIYALGIMLREMLSAPSTAAEGPHTLTLRMTPGELEPITGISEPVGELVTDMTAYDITDRIGSAVEVVRRIEQITGQSPTPLNVQVEKRRIDVALPEAVPAPATLVTPTGKIIPLTESRNVIGRIHPRDPSPLDIDLWTLGIENARTASRRHCRIFVEDGTYYIEDLGSMNGTYLNGTRLAVGQAYPLEDGDVIVVGRVKLVFRQSSTDCSPP